MASTSIHCPHCGTELDQDPSASRAGGVRCPGCRLIVAAGRGRITEHDADGRAQQGRAAGILASAARRAEADPIAPDAVLDALDDVAERLGVGVGRLRMTDYVDAQSAEPSLPSLATVLATYPAWKAARAAAETRRDGRGLAATG